MGASPHHADGTLTTAGDTWARALAGLSLDQLRDGIATVATTDTDGWPPTVAQFRASCLGLPSLAAVRRDLARTDTDRGPYTRLVWSYVDVWAYARADERAAAAIVRDAYRLAADHLLRGGALPDAPVAALAAPARTAQARQRTDAEREVAARSLAAIRRLLAQRERPSRAWAERLREREHAGETLGYQQRRLWRAALAAPTHHTEESQP